MQDFKPDVVYTHHHGDYNPDHNAVNEAVIFCTRPNPDEHAPRAIYTFEVMSSTEWADQSHNPFQPNVFANITDTLEHKLKAMQLYKGEVRNYPHPRSLDALRAVAQVRAIQSGIKPDDGKVGYAEAFHLVREVQR